MKYAGLNPKAFGLAGGILWGAGVVITALFAISVGGVLADFVTWMGEFYKGYDVSAQGALIGGIWGFVDAGIACWIFAWLYNKFNK